MSIGRLNEFIDIITTTPTKDAEGFAIKGDTIIASVRAYKEDRHGSLKWANRTVFSTATVLFKFRKIPGIDIVPSLIIACSDGRYKVVSVENVKGRGMFLEILAERAEPVKR